MGNIVLSGSSSMFPGFPERMCLELKALLHSTGCQIQVLASPQWPQRPGRGARWQRRSRPSSTCGWQRASTRSTVPRTCTGFSSRQMTIAHPTHPTGAAQLLLQEEVSEHCPAPGRW